MYNRSTNRVLKQATFIDFSFEYRKVGKQYYGFENLPHGALYFLWKILLWNTHICIVLWQKIKISHPLSNLKEDSSNLGWTQCVVQESFDIKYIVTRDSVLTQTLSLKISINRSNGASHRCSEKKLRLSKIRFGLHQI